MELSPCSDASSAFGTEDWSTLVTTALNTATRTVREQRRGINALLAELHATVTSNMALIQPVMDPHTRRECTGQLEVGLNELYHEIRDHGEDLAQLGAAFWTSHQEAVRLEPQYNEVSNGVHALPLARQRPRSPRGALYQPGTELASDISRVQNIVRSQRLERLQIPGRSSPVPERLRTPSLSERTFSLDVNRHSPARRDSQMTLVHRDPVQDVAARANENDAPEVLSTGDIRGLPPPLLQRPRTRRSRWENMPGSIEFPATERRRAYSLNELRSLRPWGGALSNPPIFTQTSFDSHVYGDLASASSADTYREDAWDLIGSLPVSNRITMELATAINPTYQSPVRQTQERMVFNANNHNVQLVRTPNPDGSWVVFTLQHGSRAVPVARFIWSLGCEWSRFRRASAPWCRDCVPGIRQQTLLGSRRRSIGHGLIEVNINVCVSIGLGDIDDIVAHEICIATRAGHLTEQVADEFRESWFGSGEERMQYCMFDDD